MMARDYLQMVGSPHAQPANEDGEYYSGGSGDAYSKKEDTTDHTTER